MNITVISDISPLLDMLLDGLDSVITPIAVLSCGICGIRLMTASEPIGRRLAVKGLFISLGAFLLFKLSPYLFQLFGLFIISE